MLALINSATMSMVANSLAVTWSIGSQVLVYLLFEHGFYVVTGRENATWVRKFRSVKGHGMVLTLRRALFMLAILSALFGGTIVG